MAWGHPQGSPGPPQAVPVPAVLPDPPSCRNAGGQWASPASEVPVTPAQDQQAEARLPCPGFRVTDSSPVRAMFIWVNKMEERKANPNGLTANILTRSGT